MVILPRQLWDEHHCQHLCCDFQSYHQCGELRARLCSLFFCCTPSQSLFVSSPPSSSPGLRDDSLVCPGHELVLNQVNTSWGKGCSTLNKYEGTQCCGKETELILCKTKANAHKCHRRALFYMSFWGHIHKSKPRVWWVNTKHGALGQSGMGVNQRIVNSWQCWGWRSGKQKESWLGATPSDIGRGWQVHILSEHFIQLVLLDNSWGLFS